MHIDTSLLQLINAEQAYFYRAIPIKKEGKTIIFVSDTEKPSNLKKELQVIFGTTIEIIKETKENIQKFLSINYRTNTVANTNELYYNDDFLLQIIHQAKEIGSSDIHFEIFEFKARVRFRIDGKLIERFIIPLLEYGKISNRIKILAGADISEKRLPQDGRITLKTTSEDFDIRVSFLPTIYGEKIVLRILNKDTNFINLENLGFTKKELLIYKQSIKKTNGIILLSGPTGSGKTTTLYATLKRLNTKDKNILTIEDPVEYTLEGINQVQLKEGIGLDFASTLRSFLRQDPDIIMVGEIRDVATANMAIKAALTGHLVLSTIHTNSAWATISRLIDMGVPSFLVASTLNISIAQRLVRKLCTNCKIEEKIIVDLFPNNFTLPKDLKTHYKAVGCEKCHHTGYSGRKAIYEIIPIKGELAEKIKHNTFEIDDYIKNNDINTLQKNAIELIQNGTTSIDEVYSLLL